jgi:hypothetical protein
VYDHYNKILSNQGEKDGSIFSDETEAEELDEPLNFVARIGIAVSRHEVALSLPSLLQR